MATEPRNKIQNYFHVQNKGIVKKNTFPYFSPSKGIWIIMGFWETAHLPLPWANILP